MGVQTPPMAAENLTAVPFLSGDGMQNFYVIMGNTCRVYAGVTNFKLFHASTLALSIQLYTFDRLYIRTVFRSQARCSNPTILK